MTFEEFDNKYKYENIEISRKGCAFPIWLVCIESEHSVCDCDDGHDTKIEWSVYGEDENLEKAFDMANNKADEARRLLSEKDRT